MARSVSLLEKSTGRVFELGRFNEGRRTEDDIMRRVWSRCRFVSDLQCVGDYEITIAASADGKPEVKRSLAELRTLISEEE